MNLIKDGHIIWGLLMVLLPFAPAAIVGVFLVFEDAVSKDTWKKKSKYGFLGLVLLVPGVIICTPLYMLFVLVTGFLKVWNPEIETDEDLGKEQFCCLDGRTILQIPPLLRMAEVVMESYPQSILGEFHCPVPNIKSHLPNKDHRPPSPPSGIYIQVMIGPPEDPTAKIFQYIGITASLLSITKGCGEW